MCPFSPSRPGGGGASPRSAWALVAGAWLALFGVLALPAATQAQTGTTLVSNIGHGIALSGTRGLLIPYTALSWRQGGARTHRTGARWQLARAAAVDLEWTHEPGTGAKPPANALMLRTQVRW